VRSIDDHGAAVSHDGLHLVHPLGGCPDVVVQVRHDGQDRLDRMIQVNHVQLRGQRSGLGLCRDRIPAVQAGEVVVPANDHAERRRRHRDVLAGLFDDLPHRRSQCADDLDVGDHRSEPVRKVGDVGAAHAREEILEPSGEAGHLVRKHRPADEQLVIVEQPIVHGHVDILLHQAATQILDARSRNGADLLDVRHVVVVVHVHAVERVGARLVGCAEVLAQLIGGHPTMRTQGNEVVQPPDARLEKAVQDAEDHGHGTRTRAVRDDH